jgi:hypothetical protein
MEDEAHSLEDLQARISDLWEEHKDDAALLNRLCHLVTNNLPKDISNYKAQMLQKKQKKDMLTSSFAEFAEEFLNENCYHFLPGSNLFIKYDNLDFSVVEEDDIQHKLYKKATAIPEFADHKTRLKTHVIKAIKERLLTSTIPESQTIQKTISAFFPFIFQTKREAQYFLTVLGDNILKDNGSLVHIIDNSAKPFLSIMSDHCTNFLGNAVALNSFKFKYYDQSYQTTRLLRTNTPIYLPDIWRQSLPADFLNVIAVACHYSDRFKGSDGFLEQRCQHTPEKAHIHLLLDNTPESIVRMFKDEMIADSGSSASRISQKNMLYLWKLFLERRNLPAIMFINSFKTVSREVMQFDESNEAYIGVTSKHLPIVGKFLDFWSAHMTTQTDDELDELEVDEVCSLFKLSDERGTAHASFQDKEMLSLIRHFFPDVAVGDDNIISNISCDTWNKQECIEGFLDDYKNTTDSSKVTLNKLYKSYCKSKSGRSLVCGKSYFERVIRDKFKDKLESKFCLMDGWFD